MNDELDEDIRGSSVVREAEDVTEGGSDHSDEGVAHVAVSYTHLTLPTKRIV